MSDALLKLFIINPVEKKKKKKKKVSDTALGPDEATDDIMSWKLRSEEGILEIIVAGLFDLGLREFQIKRQNYDTIKPQIFAHWRLNTVERMCQEGF